MQRLGLHQKLLQKLSPQQIQLMKLLQVPTAALEQRIKEELEINPALEEGSPDDLADEEVQDEEEDEFDDLEKEEGEVETEVEVEERIETADEAEADAEANAKAEAEAAYISLVKTLLTKYNAVKFIVGF